LNALNTTGFIKRTGVGAYSSSALVALTADVSGVLPLTNGGTNANLTAVNGGALYSTGSSLAITAPGTSGQVLTSSGAGAPTWATVPSDSSKVAKAGDTMTGLLVLSGDPSVALGAATKQYVDTGLSNKQNSLGYTPLNIAGDTMTGSLILPSNGLAVGSNQLVVSGGNVGIGTTSPASMFSITGGSIVVDRDDANAGLTLKAYGIGHQPVLYGRTARGTMVAPQTTAAGDTLLRMVTDGYGATQFARSGEIQFLAAENFTNTAGGSHIAFLTSVIGSVSPNEKLRITANGNVGIGTTAPTAFLQIKSGTTAAGSSLLKFTAGSVLSTPEDGSMEFDGTNYYLTSGGTRRVIGMGTIAGTLDSITTINNSGGGITLTPAVSSSVNINSFVASISSSTGAAALGFYTRASGGTGVASERMHIDPNGNVGIGTTAPNSKLEVSGDIALSAAGNTLYLNGTSGGTFLRRNGIQNGIEFFTNSTSRMFISDSPGNVGIGSTSPAYKLDVNGDINIASARALRFAGTSVCTSAGCTSSSDERLKENIKSLDNSLDKILQLRGVEYDYIDKAKYGDGHQVGVIAQEVEKVYPEVVKTDSKTGLKAVAYDHLVAPLIEAVKTIFNRITGIESNQTSQYREIASLKESKADKTMVDTKVQQLEIENKKLKQENAAIKTYLCGKDPKPDFCNY